MVKVWEDPKEVEERMKLLESMKAMDQNLSPVEENNTSRMETNTMCSSRGIRGRLTGSKTLEIVSQYS